MLGISSKAFQKPMEKHIIDATGKKIGRVAVEAASVLMGKTKPAYRPHLLPHTLVEIRHAGKLDIASKKKTTETHSRYSGFHGGLRQRTLREVIKQKGYSQILRHAIYGMIRRNKLHKQIMRHLTVTD